MGSGTTALAAIKCSRNYIGIEKEQKYVDLSSRKISDAKSQYSDAASFSIIGI